MPATFDFSKQEEIDAYLNNLDVEYRFGCLKENEPKACHLFADYLDAIKRLPDEAFKTYKRNCSEHSFPISCYKYAQFAIRAKVSDGGEESSDAGQVTTSLSKLASQETPADIKKALVTACHAPATPADAEAQAGGPACHLLAQLLINGTQALDSTTGAPPQPRRALEAYERGCYFARHGDSCYQLTGLYITGKLGDDVAPKNMELAFKHAKFACDELQHVYSCVNVARMYRLGDGVPKDAQKEKHYKQFTMNIVEQLRKNETLQFSG